MGLAHIAINTHTGRKKMKRTLFTLPLLVATLMLSNGAMAAPLGPPSATVPAGKFSVGIEGDYGDREIKRGDAALNFTFSPANLPSPFSNSEKQTIEGGEYKLKRSAYYLVPAYGITDKISLHARLGQARFKDKDDSDGINTDATTSYGVGASGTLYENNTFRIGMKVQYMTYPSAKAVDGSSSSIPKWNGTTLSGYKMDSGTFLGFYDGATVRISDVKMKASEAEASLGASFKLGAATPYVGIDYSKLTVTYSADAALAVNKFGGLEYLVLNKGNSWLYTSTRTVSMSLDTPKDKEKTPLGGYAGLDYSFTPNIKLNAEVRLINQTSYSLALSYFF